MVALNSIHPDPTPMKKTTPLLLALILIAQHGSAQPPGSGLIDSLTTRLSTLPEDSTKLNTLQALCKAQVAAFDFASGLRTATETARLSHKLGDRKGEAASYRSIAMNQYHLQVYDSALIAANEALRLNQALNDSSAVAASYDLIGSIHLEHRDLKEALENCRRALMINERLGDKRAISHSKLSVGNVHAELGQYDHALRNYFDALRLFQGFDDKATTAKTYNSIGTVYGEMGDPVEALKNFLAAEEIWTAEDDKQGLARVHMNMGHAYADLGDQGKALEQFNMARTLKSETNNRFGVAMADDNIADIRREQGRFGEALKLRRASLQVMVDIDDPDGIAGGHIDIAELLMDQHHLDEAKAELMKGLSIARKEGFPIRQKFGYGLLARLDSAQGDNAGALRNYKLHIAMRDSLMNEDKIREITRLEMKYDFNKQQLTDSLHYASSLAALENERSIQRLRAEKNRDRGLATGGAALLLLVGGTALFYSDRKRRKERFQKEVVDLQAQALRSQMNSHFIFNALHAINAFVRHNDPDGVSSFLSKFARVIRGILENSRHREVALQDDLEVLRGYIELERKLMDDKFDFTITVDEGIDQEQVMVPPLVLQPLVENAIRHGIADKVGHGHIALQVKRQGEQLVWSVEDNGVGRGAPKPIPGTDVAAELIPVKKTSLATAIIRSRLELLQQRYGGRAGLRYEDLAQGTRVMVDMPLIIF